MADSFVLYHNVASICSIMVRYTMAIAGKPREGIAEMHVQEKVIDIFNDEQLDEHFLRDLNPKGQVPVLASPTFEKPIADSLEITHFLMDRYPQLRPEKFQSEIMVLLKDLHALNYFSLSFPGRPQVAQSLVRTLTDRLNGDINDEYKRLLEYKLTVTKGEKLQGMERVATENNERNALMLMSTLESHLSANSPWLFGLDCPSALDAHIVPFIARMKDVDRYHLIPPSLKEYAEKAWETTGYNSIMNSRSTMRAR